MAYASPREFARLVGMHQKTVERQCRDGRLPAYKVGKYWRIDVNEWRQQCSQKKRPA